MAINLGKLKDSVQEPKLGSELDAIIAVEVFQMVHNEDEQEVKDINTGSVIGKSKWTAKDGTPVMLPKFSTVPFIASLILEDFDFEVTIKRKKGGQCSIKFTNGSNVAIKGERFAEAIARGVLFESRYNAVKKGAKS